jgi:Mrp family chromosome partitioning ATPase
MLGGRRKLPVLAEIAGPAPGDSRAWSLRRSDLEALAAVRTALGARRAVLVSGSEDLAAAVALAAAASSSGCRTALVECDLARPRLAAELGLNPGPGLHEYLRWEAEAGQVLQPLVHAGPAAAGATGPMVCVTAGRAAPEPNTLLGLESFRHALAKLRNAYELLVLTGPALELTSGGAVELVAAQAEATLAAAAPDGLGGQPGRLLRAQLRRLPARPVGAIAVG